LGGGVQQACPQPNYTTTLNDQFSFRLFPEIPNTVSFHVKVGSVLSTKASSEFYHLRNKNKILPWKVLLKFGKKNFVDSAFEAVYLFIYCTTTILKKIVVFVARR
jgi:hypothetical protein